ncbi:MAG: class I SAM-dependent methyltransferase [Anaerolineae bacterium]|nr:class I SAM-dependent methyltransferase [Anaerolineae bacterium]
MNYEMPVLVEDTYAVAKSVKTRIYNIWGSLEPKPIPGHSQTLNSLATADNARQIFASACAETGIIQREAATWRSLEPLYHWHEWRWRLPSTISPLVTLFLESASSRGVRNRKAIVREIEVACVNALNFASVKLLSIGGGAAPAIREMMSTAESGGHVIILDQDEIPEMNPDWLADLPHPWEYEVRCGDARELVRILNGQWRPNIVEMVGVVDYIPDKKLRGLFRHIHQVLLPGGWLITANLDPDMMERFWIHQMVGWPDVAYRNQDELRWLLTEASFDVDNAVFIQEPCQVFNIVAVPKCND